MIWVVVAAAAIWGLGHLTKASFFARWVMIGVLFAGVVLLTVVLPPENPTRVALGGGPGGWLIAGGLVALGLGYRRMITNLRTRVSAPETAPTGTFSEAELDRYARHIVLREIGGAGQAKLRDAHVLVIGAGGLGSPALQYLAAAGVGTIGVIDDDEVDNSNLQRQVIHTDERIGTAKVFSAATAMKALNPHIAVRPYKRRLTADIAPDLFADYDLILDGTDNFDTRYLANRVAVQLGKPLISGALSQWEGQISTFDPANGTPCYQCIFPAAPAAHLAPSCAEAGVLSPLPGVIGAMMAVEAVKEITSAGQGLGGRMLIYDALYGETRMITLARRPDCPICGTTHSPTGETE